MPRSPVITDVAPDEAIQRRLAEAEEARRNQARLTIVNSTTDSVKRGQVSSAGEIIHGEGFSVERLEKGVYRVFELSLPLPVAVVTATTLGCVAVVTASAANEFTVTIGSGPGAETKTDSGFNFHVATA